MRLVHAGEVEVRAVEQPRPQVVVGVVVEPHQPLGAVGIGEHPGAEPLLDQLLLLAGGERRLLVDDALLAVAVVDRCRRSPASSCSAPARAARCRWPAPCRIRRWRRPTARRRSRRRGSRPRLSSGGRPGSADGATRKRSAAKAWMSLSGIHGAPRLASMSPGSTSSGCTARRASALRA